MQRIPHGVTDQYIYFFAVDSTDLKTPETGHSSFTVRRSRNGNASAAFTTPTINETDVTNMPGWYELLMDEDTSLDAGDQSQIMALHITQASMAPAKLVIEIYRPDVTAGETLTVASGIGQASVQSIANNAITAASNATDAIDADAIADNAINAGAIASDAITAAKIATGAITSAKFAAGAIDAAAIADGAIDAATLASDTITAAKIATGAFTAAKFAAGAIDAAALAADAGTEIAAAVWDRLTSALTAVGSAGKLLVDNLNATVSSRATQTSVDTIDDFLDTEVAAIKAKTDNLPSDPADASDIAASFTTVNTKLDTIDDFLDTEIAAIKAKTDNLPSDPADASDIASSFSTVNTKLDTIDDFLDTEVATIKGVTDKLDTALELDGAVYRYTTNALEQAPTGGVTPPTVAEIADEVQTRTIAAVTLVNGLAANTVTASALAADAVTEIQSGLATSAALATTQTSIDDLPTNAELATALGTADDAVLAQVALVKAKTDNLPSDPADASVVAGLIAAAEAKIDIVDTVVDAIKLKTDNLPSDPADQSLIIAATDALAALIDALPTNAELATALASADDATLAAIAALTIPSAAAVADAVHDEVVEGTLTFRQAIRLQNAAMFGKLSGAATTNVIIRDVDDTLDRLDVTVDANGNRSAIIRNVT